jgi:hypothetical protein
MAGRFSQRRYRAEHCRWQCLIAASRAQRTPTLLVFVGIATFFHAATLQTDGSAVCRPSIPLPSTQLPSLEKG